MPTHVALLRGINVGGGGKLAMADLRQLLSSLGHTDVTTYIQSGNVVFTPSQPATSQPATSQPATSQPAISQPAISQPAISQPATSQPATSHSDNAVLAGELRAAIAAKFGIDTPVIVVTKAELSDVISANPYRDEPNPRYVHAVFLPAELSEAARTQIKQAEGQVR